MQVQNFECQIAKAQIGRYLAGDSLSDETVQQLEDHIGKCEDCKQNLAERKAVLQAMLSPAEAVVAPATKSSVADLIKSKLNVRAVVADSTRPATDLKKPTLYAAALALVLIGMSYASKNMGSIMGPKAAETIAPVAAPTVASKADFKDATASVVIDVSPARLPAPAVSVRTAPKVASRPKPTKKISNKTAPRPRTKRSSASGTIRVYAPNE